MIRREMGLITDKKKNWLTNIGYTLFSIIFLLTSIADYQRVLFSNSLITEHNLDVTPDGILWPVIKIVIGVLLTLVWIYIDIRVYLKEKKV